MTAGPEMLICFSLTSERSGSNRIVSALRYLLRPVTSFVGSTNLHLGALRSCINYDNARQMCTAQHVTKAQKSQPLFACSCQQTPLESSCQSQSIAPQLGPWLKCPAQNHATCYEHMLIATSLSITGVFAGSHFAVLLPSLVLCFASAAYPRQPCHFASPAAPMVRQKPRASRVQLKQASLTTKQVCDCCLERWAPQDSAGEGMFAFVLLYEILVQSTVVEAYNRTKGCDRYAWWLCNSCGQESGCRASLHTV